MDAEVRGFLDRIKATLNEHERWRSNALNLSAAENAQSPAVKGLLTSDLTQRYADYQGRDTSARKYRGTRYIQSIEALTTELLQKVFSAGFVELRGVSGHITDIAVMLGLTRPGGIILETGSDPGGHGDGRKLCENPLISAQIAYFPFDARQYTIDLDRTIAYMREHRPNLIKLGTSSFLFPHPVAAIREEADRLGDMWVAYDASHVFGLIAGGRFQDPLREGAHVMMGSSHKTLPGPQGGLILSNDAAAIEKVSAAIYPILVSNHHLARLPALSMALVENLLYGREYAAQIIANARQLAEQIHRLGVPVVAAHKGYTESHTILLQTKDFGDNQEIARRLDDEKIIVNASRLPSELGGHGIRIGVQEITRRGAKETDMKAIAQLIVQVIRKQRPAGQTAMQVEAFCSGFQSLSFALGAGEPA